MAEISIVSNEAHLALILNIEESKAFMDLFNYLCSNNEVFEATGKDTYKVLNNVYWQGSEVLDSLGKETKDKYFDNN